MQINIIAVGKLKEKYWTQAVAEYAKRLSAYAKLRIVEVVDESTPDTLSPAEEEAIKEKEATRILAQIKDRDYVVALAIEGKTFTSEQWAKEMERLTTMGHSSFAFVIGGSLGLHHSVLTRANLKLSFSSFTFPHQMVRVILLEQLYRGFRIMRGEPYHK
ncbi:ribosomal RNA large subunit methyltransferase H [Collibacillus ludicampi]|uniref:Ribosomal RNA large subunit methyltransferase H n=1 Tax=Collibacillus ludicampi TaxID=2771369 RepID=A0AAV4LDE5_9BACL|nr:23S rRNA (pseudouridine(1915)-N(3))-methyltransferase RlmH [Collibacillus ludicampi]GIM45845.1 ribosomal RNA large subunit methyltransferase H [Collibacillus ludicampi]